MFDVLKQAVFIGLGLASLTREKAEQLADEIARRAKLSEQESKEFQAELASRTEQARQELEAEIDRRIDHAFIQLGIVKAGVKKESEAAKAELRTAIDKESSRYSSGWEWPGLTTCKPSPFASKPWKESWPPSSRIARK